jgi:hypothetical protein
MPREAESTQGESTDLDDFIDQSMEGTEDDFDTGADDNDELDAGDDAPSGRPVNAERDDDHDELDGVQRQPREGPQQSAPNQQGAQATPPGLTPVGKVFADKQGNIVNSQGRVIAPRGEAARHWMDMSKQLTQVPNLVRQNQALAGQIQQSQQLLDQARQISELPQKYNMSREDFNEGMALLGNWTRDPVGVAREIVSRTVAMGHNVSDILGKSAGDALEMGAIRQLINEATRGQRQREEQEIAVTARQEQGRAAYNAFISRYPDAETHSDAIANLMNNHQLSATEAYYQVKQFCMKYGLDWNTPLAPQIQAARAQQQPNGDGRRSPTQRAPMSPGASGGRATLTQDTQYADADSDWGSILNNVLRESQ